MFLLCSLNSVPKKEYKEKRKKMKVLILVAIVAVVTAQDKYSSPSYNKDYKYEPRPYNFAWAVKDDPSYNDYAHQQDTDAAGKTYGSYRVLLPDGRVQTVTYNVDAYTGYVADVQYTGEAKYPEYKSNYPAYKPSN
ncbi:cuticle protein 19-like [Artemia franciscana]|uniref:cuticle protein 19-like n=1 Tax=Artemia franciscana TaxID=6661 RepID=UPI0032DA7677